MEDFEDEYKNRHEVKMTGNSKKELFIRTYNEEVSPQRIKYLDDELSKIELRTERIKFLIDEKAKYLKKISPGTLESSGYFHSSFPHGAELFFDRYIQIEIDKEKSQLLIEKEYNVPEVENIKQQHKKIIWNGTPGQFGALISKLINTKVISVKPKELKRTMNYLSEVFEITGQNGKEVTAKHLYECLSDGMDRNFSINLKFSKEDNK